MVRTSLNAPRFSIVIPTYNRAAFIETTIRSVLVQEFDDFEVIVVDDGSTDETEKVVAAIDDPRIQYYWKQNEERAAARNAGASFSNGEYITFLDSDDLVYEQHLKIADEMIRKHNAPEWFHLGYECLNVSSNERSSNNELPEIANGQLVYGNHLSCDGVFIRRDIAFAMPFNAERDLSATEDYELWLRLASRYPLYCDKRVTSAIVQHDERSVVNADRQKLEKRISLLETSVFGDPEFRKVFGSKASRFKANNRIYIALHLALSKNDRLGAITFLLRALACSPYALSNRAFYGTLKRLIV